MRSVVSRRAFSASLVSAAILSTEDRTVAGELRSQALAASSPDLTSLTLTEISARIRSRSVTPTQLVTACLERIKIYNPKINAFITVLREQALAEATQLDAEQKAGRFRSALHGVPIALKDNIDTAGIRTTAGSAVFDDRFPTQDAEVARRLKAAGAVTIGKANLHEFARGERPPPVTLVRCATPGRLIAPLVVRAADQLQPWRPICASAR